jgi:hypothetical protein
MVSVQRRTDEHLGKQALLIKLIIEPAPEWLPSAPAARWWTFLVT